MLWCSKHGVSPSSKSEENHRFLICHISHVVRHNENTQEHDGNSEVVRILYRTKYIRLF